jgi:hypothetical protein
MNLTVTTDGHTVTVWSAGAPVLELTPAQALKLGRELSAALTPQQVIDIL